MSKNNYFWNPETFLRENRKQVDLFLQIKGYELQERSIYLEAYDFFVKHPEEFDGATMTEDLYDVDNLELAAMLHDFLYLNDNAAGNFYYSWLADKLMRAEMKRMGKSSWNTGVRFVLLILKAPFFVPFTYFFKGRKMTDANKKRLVTRYQSLAKRKPKKWYQEFKGELIWTAVVLINIIGILKYIF